jgi:hypothetical protein
MKHNVRYPDHDKLAGTVAFGAALPANYRLRHRQVHMLNEEACNYVGAFCDLDQELSYEEPEKLGVSSRCVLFSATKE